MLFGNLFPEDSSGATSSSCPKSELEPARTGVSQGLSLDLGALSRDLSDGTDWQGFSYLPLQTTCPATSGSDGEPER